MFLGGQPQHCVCTNASRHLSATAEFLVFSSFYPRNVVSAVLATATWLAGWVSVTHRYWWVSVTCRYCIKTAKPIFKLFRPSGSPIILVSSDLCRYPILRVTPSAGAINTRWVGKISDFRWKLPFFPETVRDRPMVTMECQ